MQICSCIAGNLHANGVSAHQSVIRYVPYTCTYVDMMEANVMQMSLLVNPDPAKETFIEPLLKLAMKDTVPVYMEGESRRWAGAILDALCHVPMQHDSDLPDVKLVR